MANNGKTIRGTIKSQIRRLSTVTPQFAPVEGRTRQAGAMGLKQQAGSRAIDAKPNLLSCGDSSRRRGSTSTSSISEGHTRDSSPCGGASSADDKSGSVSPVSEPSSSLAKKKTPVSKDSPLLNKGETNLQLKRVQDFNRSLRRGKSFRARHHQHRRSTGEEEEEEEEDEGGAPEDGLDEVTFCISRVKFGRRGWKVTAEEEGLSLRRLGSNGVLGLVVGRIRALEFAGQVVPERMTIRL